MSLGLVDDHVSLPEEPYNGYAYTSALAASCAPTGIVSRGAVFTSELVSQQCRYDSLPVVEIYNINASGKE